MQKSKFYIFFVYDASIPFKVAIDYKGQEFTGINAGEKLTRLIIEMNFEKVGGTWRLTDIEIKDFEYNVSLQYKPPPYSTIVLL